MSTARWWGAVFFSFKFYCTLLLLLCVGAFCYTRIYILIVLKNTTFLALFSIPNNMNYNFLEVHLQKIEGILLNDTPGIKINMVGCPSFSNRSACKFLRLSECKIVMIHLFFILNTKCKYTVMSRGEDDEFTSSSSTHIWPTHKLLTDSSLLHSVWWLYEPSSSVRVYI